ncbi:PAS domain-containing protein [Pelagibius sp.]|uniref:PAS domain-containing protein n=1 Tax=Pelagibius sp. TaxID=1931238 RepID=UPI00260D59B2|nr:PAS domain-containing protein [Pelagibius sp.]
MAFDMTAAPQDFSLPPGCAPKIRALYDYWRSIHPEAGLPGRQHFDPIDVPELLPNIWMVDINREPLRFRFRLVGTAIVKFTERDATGQWLDAVYPDYWNSDAAAYHRACALDGTPAYRKSHATPPSGGPGSITGGDVESLTLPLAGNGRDVDILLNMTLYPEDPVMEMER